MEIHVLLKRFSSGLTDKFGLEVIINKKQYLLKREDGIFYKYALNKTGTGYLKTKSSTKNDVIESFVKNRLSFVDPKTLSIQKNVDSFESLKHLFV